MRCSFPIQSSSCIWAIASAIVLMASGCFTCAGQTADIQVEYGATISPEVKNAVEALIRGEMPKPQVAAEESKRRQAYATERFQGPNTSRGRFYVGMGAPDRIESRTPAETGEVWYYRRLGFTVAFLERYPTNRPRGVRQSMWIPLSENSGIVLRDTRSKSVNRGTPLVHGTIMARIDGLWVRVSLESEAGVLPVQK